LNYNLVINANDQGCRIALLKDKDLVEFHYEEETNEFKVGDIYLGIVKKIVPGLNAAFVDIGFEKDAFLHYLDLGAQVKSLIKFVNQTLSRKNTSSKLGNFSLEPEIDKSGKIGQVLNRNQQMLVQVVKEPISSKGPRLTSELSLAGRYLVLVPFSNAINVSKKITESEERKRLTRLISSIKPENFGVIIRTVAKNKDVAELDKDLQNLIESWEEGFTNLKKAKPRTKIIGEIGRASSIIRDMLNEDFDSIYIDNKNLFDETRIYIKNIAPEKEKIVRLYNGKAKIFEQFGIEKQLKSLFGQTVNLPNGGYIIIEHTEALHSIDVNSGNKSNSSEDQEATALNVNLESAKEIARQLRLRDMGGIIVIDFIDMRKIENRRLVFEKMKHEMKEDRSKYTILPLSKFGLMQITRQRVRPELILTTKETCPTCGGTGKIAASILVSDQIEKNLEYILTRQNEKKITIILHPYLYSYFTKGLVSIQLRWFLHFLIWIRIQKDTSLGITDFKFINKAGDPIEI
jgi:ribonuclease G